MPAENESNAGLHALFLGGGVFLGVMGWALWRPQRRKQPPRKRVNLSHKPLMSLEEIRTLLEACPKAELRLYAEDPQNGSYVVFRSGRRWVFEPWDTYEDDPGTYSWGELLHAAEKQSIDWRVMVTAGGRLSRRKNGQWQLC